MVLCSVQPVARKANYAVFAGRRIMAIKGFLHYQSRIVRTLGTSTVFHTTRSNPTVPWQCRVCYASFSTSKSDDSCGESAAVKKNEILEIASREANHLSALAATRTFALIEQSSGKNPPLITTEDAMNAVDAAQALLALTFPPESLMDATTDNGNLHPADSDDMKEQVASLHRAFLAVTSWCLNVASADPSLLIIALDLCRRSSELSLAFHLPLYQQLVTAVAQHSKANQFSTAAMILDVSSYMKTTLQVPIEKSFFREPLVALARNNQIREIIDLSNGMKARHGIDSFGYNITADIIDVLGWGDDRCEDEIGALEELLPILRDTLRQDQEYLDVSEEANNNIVDTIADGGFAGFTRVQLPRKAHEEITNTQSSRDFPVSERDMANDDEGSFINSKEGDEDLEESSDHDSDQETGDELIYVRDAYNWKLPDVTEKAIELNGGREILYTLEYENKLADEINEWTDDNYSDDDF